MIYELAKHFILSEYLPVSSNLCIPKVQVQVQVQVRVRQ